MSAYWNLCIIEKASFEQPFATGLFPGSQCCPIIPYLRLIDWKISYGTNGCRFLSFLLWPLYCLSYDYRFSIIKRPVCSFVCQFPSQYYPKQILTIDTLLYVWFVSIAFINLSFICCSWNIINKHIRERIQLCKYMPVV
jgi:hypothetical protein